MAQTLTTDKNVSSVSVLNTVQLLVWDTSIKGTPALGYTNVYPGIINTFIIFVSLYPYFKGTPPLPNGVPLMEISLWFDLKCVPYSTRRCHIVVPDGVRIH